MALTTRPQILETRASLGVPIFQAQINPSRVLGSGSARSQRIRGLRRAPQERQATQLVAVQQDQPDGSQSSTAVAFLVAPHVALRPALSFLRGLIAKSTAALPAA